MALFKKKEKAVKAILTIVEEKPLEYTIQSIERRIILLTKIEKKVQEKIISFEENMADLEFYSADNLKEIQNEMADIKEQNKLMQQGFNVLITTLSSVAKKEDFEKMKRLAEQYDLGDMITRSEFDKLFFSN